MSNIKQPLSVRSALLLAEFDHAAQAHGWDKDQGSREAATTSAAQYAASLARLTARIRQLEKAAV